MAFGVIRLPCVTFGLFSNFSGYFLALFGFAVDAVMGRCEDFGKVGEIEPLDEGKGNGAEVCLRPRLNAANETFNHCSKFTFCSR
jgi:hypothetical protein